MKNTGRNKTSIILILGALMAVSPFSIDMYLPGFSHIAKDFGTTASRISLTVSAYFVGLALGQLFYGPLLDRFGRKRPLYFGLSLYIVACIGCILSRSLEVFIVLRFIQALGGCVAQVGAITMARDFFPVEESAKIFSLLILILGLSPLLAPTIGGFIVSGLGWHWVFAILALLALTTGVIVFIYLPNAYQPDDTISLGIKPMLAVMMSIIKNPQFYTYALSGSFSFAALFVYVAGSPVIFMELFHISPAAYGGIFALLSVGFIGGNQLNIWVLHKYNSEQIFRTMLICQVITGLLFFAGSLNNSCGLTGDIIFFFISLLTIGFVFPNSSALALSPFTKNLGSASALLGFLQVGIAGLISGGVGLFILKNDTPVIAMFAGTAIVAFIILIGGKRKAGSLAFEQSKN